MCSNKVSEGVTESSRGKQKSWKNKIIWFIVRNSSPNIYYILISNGHAQKAVYELISSV